MVTRLSVEYDTEGFTDISIMNMFWGEIRVSVLNECSIYVMYYILISTGKMSVEIGL